MLIVRSNYKRIEHSIKPYVDIFNKGLDISEDKTYDFLHRLLKDSNLGDLQLSYKDKSVIIETYNILVLSKTPIKLINRDSITREIASLEALSDVNQTTFKTKHFLSLNKYFYMIPLMSIRENIYGFILRKLTSPKRSDDNKYDSILLTGKEISPMYGFDKSFIHLDKIDKCEPIVLCEGLKDCIYLKQFYPYVLANNGSKLSRDDCTILRQITDKLVLVYDNDSTGIASTVKDCKRLKKLGFTVDYIDIKRVLSDSKIKDPAELINYPELSKHFQEYFLGKIEQLR